MTGEINQTSDFVQKLTFRRQYIIGADQYLPNKYWRAEKLSHGLVLSIHQDLDFYSKEKNGRRITLIGLATDCTKPHRKEWEILSVLMDEFDDIRSVIQASKPLAGRWILVCQDLEKTYIFTDPCGLRQLYYYSDGACYWCASQPALIDQVHELSLTTDESIWELRNNTKFKKKESCWLGNRTIYENCYHLLPNHYFDWNKCSEVRFFPDRNLPTSKNIDNLINKTASYIKNIMHGLNQRDNIKLGLSAGYDSRLLLAASVDIADEVTFTTDNLGLLKNYHADIYVPKRLAKRLNLNANVMMDGYQEPPDWFYQLLSQNVTNARVSSPVLPKIKSIYKELVTNDSDYLLVSGNATEIVRVDDFCAKYDLRVGTGIDYLQQMIEFYNCDVRYVRKELKRWIDSIDVSGLEGATIFDMFHWEQEMGNWGAQFPAELDIAAESVSPFNCRLLLETCLQVPKELRRPPETSFFKDVISRLWPEALSEPINPGPKGIGLLKETMRKKLPSGAFDFMRRYMSLFLSKS